MTCARREAGAHRSAPSTSAASSWPDPRPGRCSARLSRLLPALALLLGALSAFAAAPAMAQTVLVKNLGQTATGGSWSVDSRAAAQGFTTGSQAGGYALGSISLVARFNASASQTQQIRVELWDATPTGVPNSSIASLTVPSAFSAGTVSFAAPSNTTLTASTTYFVVVYTTANYTFGLKPTNSDNEDSGGATGWSIADGGRRYSAKTPTAAGTWGSPLAAAIQIGVYAAQQATGPDAPTFDPADGETTTDAAGNITLTFAEAIKADDEATPTDFTATTIKNILTLTQDDENGTAIPYGATIDSAKKVVTIDPTSNLADGAVYVAVSDAWYDAEGNQGSAAEATFTVDTTAPAATFSPADGDTVTDAGGNITLTFTEAIKSDGSGTEFTGSTIDNILTLKAGSSTGSDINFDATIDSAKKVVTINPAADLPSGAVYVAVSNGYYDAVGNRGAAANATFTVDAGPAPPSVPQNVQVIPGEGKLVLRWQEPASWGEWTPYRFYIESKLDAAGEEFAAVVTLTRVGRRYEYTPPDTQAYILRIRASSGSVIGGSIQQRYSPWVETASVRPHAEASEAPGAVSSLTATSGDKALDIAWQAPSGAVAGYDVHITASSTVDDDADPVNRGRPETGWRHTWNAYTGLVPSHTFDRLTNGTAHRVRVRAKNSQGAGPWEFVTATPSTVPGKPAVTVVAGKEELRVSWTAATGGSAITGYAVQYKESDAPDAPATTANDPSTGWVAHAHSGTATTATIAGLTDGTGYDVRVRATNANGDGPWSDAAQGTPALTVPDAPDQPTATASVTGPGVTELAVSWTAPNDRGSAVTGYGVRYAETIIEGGVRRHLPYETHAEQLTGTSTTITGLKPGITYIVQVRARNAAGWGAWSRLTESTTPTTVPAKPAVTLVAGAEELFLSWTEPESGGSAITGYAVQYKESDAADAPATTPNDASTGWVAHTHSGAGRTGTIAGLTNGTGYDVRVRATNAIGDGEWSDAAQGTPESGGAPAAPARPTAMAAGVDELAVSWETPYDRGSAITAYHVLYGPAGGFLSHWADDLTGTSTTITGLNPGILYFVRVRAQNAAGWGEWSEWLQVRTQSTVPGKPAVTLDAGNGALGVSWTAETGGSAITGYAVQYKESDAADAPATAPNDPSTGWVAHAHSGAGTTATIGGLTDGTGYDVRVRATNANGDGEWSDAAQGTPESGRVPAKPAQPTATADVTELAVSWEAPYDRGSAITAYHVLYGPAGGATSNWADDLTGTSTTITGLRPGTHYFLRVRAMNAAGWSAWSEWLQVFTPSTVPGKPAVTVDGGNGELGVSWNRPSTGGLAITGYTVQYKASAAADAPATTPNDPSTGWVAHAHSGAGTTATIGGVTNGTAYDVRVRATNANGDGEWSDVAQGTPGRAAAPAVLDVRAGFERLDLEWTASLATVTGYDVHYTSSSSAGNDDAASGNDPSAAWVDARHTGTTASLAIAGLANGTEYRVRVRAVNTAGTGAWARGTGTPALTVPDAPAEPTAAAGVTDVAVSWTAPHDRGSAITAYHVQYFLNQDFWTDWRSDLTGTTTTITGLLPGSAYGVRVRAMNAAGWGAWSTYRSFRTRTTAWSATLNVKALGSGKTGCDNAVATARCSSSAVLTDNGFRAGGADIAIRTIEDTGTGTGVGARFFVQFSTSNDALKALNFCVGSTAHALSSLTSGHFLTKNAPGLVWEAGDTVALSIGATCQAGTPPSSAPGAPTGLQLEPGNARLDLRWTAAFGTVAGYDVHYTSAPATGQDAVENDAELASDSNAATGWVDARHGGTRTAHAITGLANGTAYRVRVRAVNAAGASAWLHGTGMPVLPPPDAPTRLAVSPSDAKLDLSWTAPAGTLTGYDVHYTASATVDPNAAPGSDAAAAWVAVSRTEADPPAASQSIAGLTNGTRYRVRVRAENTAGAGEWAFGAGAPSATGTVWSATLTAKALGSDAVGCDNSVGGAQCSSTAVLTEDDFRVGGADISIRELRDTGTGTGAGARFFVQFSTSNDALKALNFCIGSTAYALSGILRDHGLGANAPGLVWLAGDSVFLSIGTSCPPGPAAAPAKPTDFTAVTGDARLNLRWTAPAGMLARFDVHYTSAPKMGDGAVGDDAAASGNDASAGWVDAGHAGVAVTHALTGLDNGTEYRARVRAVNAAGAGAWEFVTATPDPKTWWIGPQGYTVREGVSAYLALNLSEAAPAGGLGFTLKPLFGEVLPDKCVRAHKATAADIGANPPATLRVSAGRTSAEVRFPTALDLIAEGDECFAVQFAGTQATVDAGWVASAEEGPYGDLSAAQVLIYNVVPPAAPADLAATPGDGRLDLTWTAPPVTEGAVISRYDVHYTSAGGEDVGNRDAASGADPAAAWVAVSRSGTAASQAITGLANGRDYRVRVRAVGSVPSGNLGFWAFATATLADRAAPGAPTGLAVAAGTGGLSLTWTAPASGGVVRGYDVHYTASASAGNDAEPGGNTDPSAGWVDAGHTGTEAGQRIDGLADGTAYRVRVRAVNAAGNSAWARGTGTPAAAAPGAPPGLSVGEDHRTLNLSWRRPAGAVTSWDVHYTSAPATGQGAVGDDEAASGADPSAAWVDAGHTGTAEADELTGLTNGTAYRVRVRGVNASGAGAWARGTGTPLPVMGFKGVTSAMEEGKDKTVTVKLSEALAVETTVSVQVDASRPASERAEETEDFTLSAATLTFAAGDTEQSFTVSAVADLTTEGNESAFLRLAAPGGAPYRVGELYALGINHPHDVTIYDTSREPGLRIAASSPMQEGAVEPVLVHLGSPAPAGGTEVTLSVGAVGTAFEGRDFTLSAKTATIAEGDTYTEFTLTALDDDADDDGEYFLLNATSAAPAFTAPTHTVRIVDTDAPASAAPQNFAAAPGVGTLTVTWETPAAVLAADDYAVRLQRKKKGAGMDFADVPATVAERNAGSKTMRNLDPVAWQVRARFEYVGVSDPVAAPELDDIRMWTAWANVEGTPLLGAATGLTVTPDNAKLDLAWTAPSGTLTGYDVHYTAAPDTGQGAVGDDEDAGSNTDAATGWVAVDRGTEADPPAASQSIGSLTNGTAYRVRVRAASAASHGAWVRGTGTPANPDAPSVPQNVTVTPGDAKLTIAWEAPASWGTWEAQSFYVQWKLSSAVASLYDGVRVPSGASYAVIAPTDTSFEFSGQQTDFSGNQITIANGTAYDLRIQAISQKPNTDGMQESHLRASSWVTVTDKTPTADPPPAAPTGLTVTPDNAKLDLAWTAPSGTLTGYDVHYTSAPDTGQGAVGDDEDAGSNTDAATGWVAVDRGTEADPPAASQSIGSLTNGTAYRVRVRATSAAGHGAWLRGTGTPANPDAPSDPRNVTVTPGDAKLTIAWEAPASWGTWEAHSFFVQWKHSSADASAYDSVRVPDGESYAVIAHTDTRLEFTGRQTSADGVQFTVANGTAYDLRIQARSRKPNTDGTQDGHYRRGGWVAVTGKTPTADPPPGAPTGLNVTAGDGTLDLAWTAPTGTVTGYDVHYTTSTTANADADLADDGDPATGWVDAGHTGTAASHAISGLTNDTQYRLRVRAANAAGNSGWLAGAAAPQRVAPGPPANLRAHSADAAAELAWEAPSVGAERVTGYDVHYTSAAAADVGNNEPASGADPSAGWVAVSRTEADPPARSQTVAGLANGTDYRFRVRSVNIDVASRIWQYAEARPVALAQPADLRARAGDAGLHLSWSAQPHAGDRVRYALDYTSAAEADVENEAPASGADPAAAWVGASGAIDGTSHTLGGLDNGTAYRVRLRATRPGEEGPWGFAAGTPTAGAAVWTVTLSAAPNPVAEGASVTVTATVSAPITGAREVRVPLTVTGGTAAETRMQIGVRRNEAAGSVTIATAHDADADDETLTVAIDTANLPPELAAGSPSSVEIEVRDDEGSSPLPAMDSRVCPASGLVWSATMTAGEGSPGTNPDRYIGYVRSHPSLADMGTLTRSRFAYRNETVYGIERIFRLVSTTADRNGSLTVRLTGAYTEAVAASLALHAGGRAFRFADAIQSEDKRTLTWRDSGLEWMRGGQVGLCLTDTAVTLSYNDPVYEGQELRLTATVPHPLTAAVTIPVHITDALTYQETTLDDGFPGITIPADAASGTGTIFLPHDEDTVSESYRVRLGALPAPLVAGDPNPLYVTVYDDDEPVLPAEATLRALRNPVAEGLRAQFRLALSHALEEDAAIPVTVTRGTSEDGDHGTLESITVPAGDVHVDAHVWTAKDADTEDETFTVALDAANLPDGVKPGSPASVEFTVTDDGEAREPPAGTPTVSLYAHPNPVEEGGTVTVRARLSALLVDDVTIPVTVTRGTSEGGDHGTLSGIAIPFGSLEATAEIETAVDADTDDETFTVAIDTANLPDGVAAGDTVFGGPSVTVTITDQGAGGAQPAQGAPAQGASAQPPVPEVSVAGGGAVTEGGPASFTLRADPAPSADLAVAVSVAQRGDFAQASHTGPRTVTIPAGAASASFAVETVDDNADEPDGAIEVSLGNGNGYTLGSAAGAAVAVADDDEPIPEVTLAAGGAVTEGAAARFTLSADPAPASDVAVTVSIAQSGEFAAASETGSRTVTIPAGAASASFAVATVDDNADEPDGAVEASLGSGTGYTLGSVASATVAVADDDEPLPGISTDRGTAREAPGAVVGFTVTLSHAAPHTVTVDYATADGAGPRWAGTMPAAAGADYTAASGTLTFAPGERYGSVEVTVLDDAIDEGTEYFLLRLSNPGGAYVEPDSAEVEGLIRNADSLQTAWLSRFGRTVGTQVSDAVTGRLEGPEPAAHVTVAGQRLDLNREDSGQALAETVAGIAQLFAAQSTAEESGGPFAAFGPADGGSAPRSGPADSSAAHGGGAGSGSAPRSGAAHGGGAGSGSAPRSGSGARGVTNRDILLGSSFHVAWGRGGNGLRRAGAGPQLDGNGLQRAGAGPRFAAWGQVAQARFDGAETGDSGRMQLGGEVLTRVLGADADFGRVLAGVALSLSDGEGTFDNPGVDVGNTGRLASTMTTVSPYVRVHLNERLSAWGLAGAGTGDMSIRFDGGALADVDTGLSMRMGAAGARGELLSQGGSGAMDLALKADALFVRTGAEKAPDSIGTDADTSRVRLVLEGGRRFSLPNGSTLHPKLELGVRHDGGDAETGAGVELGGSVAYGSASGLSVEASARRLVAHADADYEEWGASAALRFDPGEPGKGLSLSLAPTFGSAASGTERLWGVADARGLAPGGGFSAPGGLAQAGMTLVGQLGYGIESYRLRGSITPTLGYAAQHAGGATLRFGTDYAANAKWLGAELSIGLGLERGETPEGADWGGELRATMRW